MKMLIDGEWVDASDRPVAQHGRRAIATMPSYQRAALIQHAADALPAEHAALSWLLARENGKTLREVRSELG